MVDLNPAERTTHQKYQSQLVLSLLQAKKLSNAKAKYLTCMSRKAQRLTDGLCHATTSGHSCCPFPKALPGAALGRAGSLLLWHLPGGAEGLLSMAEKVWGSDRDEMMLPHLVPGVQADVASIC